MSGGFDLDLVGPNPEFGGDRPAGCLRDFVGAGATELEPRQSRYLPLLEHAGEAGAAAALDLASMLMDQFGSVLAHRDLLFRGPAQGRSGKSFIGRPSPFPESMPRWTSCRRPLAHAESVNNW